MIQVLAITFLGWVVGALINYLADVLPTRRKLSAPFCLTCGQEQNWRNYLLWPRLCSNCSRRRSLRTWIVELVSIVATVWLWYSPAERLSFPAGLLLLFYFGVIVVIDIEHRLILHSTTLAGSVLGLVIGIWLNGLPLTLVGGAAGFAAMLFLYLLGAVFVRIMSRRRGEASSEEALGFGDVTLSGVLGLILGWPGIMVGLTFTIILAGAASLVYLIAMILNKKYRSNLSIPYGPFLILGAILILYFRL